MKLIPGGLIVFILFLPLLGIAENTFKEVSVSGDSWEIIFKSEGVRFRIEIDGKDRGISDYDQELRLENGQRLSLIEKHSSLEVRPIRAKQRVGILILQTHRDPRTGESKTIERFEPNHKAEQVKAPDR